MKGIGGILLITIQKIDEIKKVYHKEYRQANKDKLNEKVNCECGCEIVKTHLKRHKATKKHIDIMNEK